MNRSKYWLPTAGLGGALLFYMTLYFYIGVFFIFFNFVAALWLAFKGLYLGDLQKTPMSTKFSNFVAASICIVALVFTAGTFGTAKVTVKNLALTPLEKVKIVLPLNRTNIDLGEIEPDQQRTERLRTWTDDSPKLVLLFKGRPTELGLGYLSTTTTLKSTIIFNENGEISSHETYY